MARELRVHVTAVDGKDPFDLENSDVYDEFAPLRVPTKIPGFVLRWCDRDTRVLPVRKRQGYVPCRKEDFPEGHCPVEPSPGGELILGDSILCKIPLELWAKRKDAERRKHQDKRRAGIRTALQAGEELAHALRAQGLKVGKNVVYEPDADEMARDRASDIKLRTRDSKPDEFYRPEEGN